ncbi:MAG TPA: GNAT family N-acetyltransferase [Trebonia sp.]|nr:GNAT family N-acetyltransferase [Trebonia sp.]
MTIAEAQIEGADTAARAAAARAGVRIRELAELPDLAAACALFDKIWQPGPGGQSPLHAELLRALTKAGNYASGAYDAATGDLIGACMGFFGPPAEASLHSHIAGVLPTGLRRAVGFALKVHQRAWCLHRGVRAMHWTFDPLIRRNAYFNMAKLGARPAEYLTNFYGPMNDSINGSAETDRMLVHWDLLSDLVVAACAGRPGPASAAAELARGAVVALGAAADGWPSAGPFGLRGDTSARFAAAARTVLVAVPPDIEGMRRADPRCAAAWRTALRDALAPLMECGATVPGFDRDGWYVVSLDAQEGAIS